MLLLILKAKTLHVRPALDNIPEVWFYPLDIILSQSKGFGLFPRYEQNEEGVVAFKGLGIVIDGTTLLPTTGLSSWYI